nr:reverse transcriptase domain-containing protein [Tanacetum cinerariifolium]
MDKEDEEKIAFITNQGIFFYSKMPFGLKNAGATYQRLVDKAFQKQIGRNLEVYMDDLVIKSCTEHEIMRDIEETFKTLREINMKLNPKKCTFGIAEDMLLGYKVNTKGIKVCPDKVEAMLSLPSPKCLKDIQKLNAKLASLNRFLSKSVENSLPFFKTLKKCTKKSDFQWTTEAEVAFKEIKKLIAELPTLIAPMEKRSANCVPYGCARSSLVHVSKQLKRYFQAHLIIVIMDQPIKQVLSKPEIAKRMQKWSIELGEYDIQYMPRTSVKGQILAYFIVERSKDKSLVITMDVKEEPRNYGHSLWTGTQKWKQKADALRKITSTSFAHLTKQVLVEELKEKSIHEAEVLTVVEEEGSTWMTPFYEYLMKETLLVEKEKERAIRWKSGRYAVINGVLYKKSYRGT